MAHLDVNGCRFWYQLRGSGDYLLQIGAPALGHLNFPRGFTEAMAERFTVIECDPCGAGLSTRPGRGYSIERWADDYAALLDGLGIEQAFVHGIHIGGMVALKLAATRPDLVAGLVVGATAAKFDSYSRYQMETRKALAQAYGLDSVALAEYSATIAFSREYLDSPAVAADIDRIAKTLASTVTLEQWCDACDVVSEVDLRKDLESITAPTLVTSGELDDNMPLDMGPDGAGTRYIAETIASAELDVMAGCGHYRLIERPVESAQVIFDFLDRVRSATHST